MSTSTAKKITKPIVMLRITRNKLRWGSLLASAVFNLLVTAGLIVAVNIGLTTGYTGEVGIDWDGLRTFAQPIAITITGLLLIILVLFLLYHFSKKGRGLEAVGMGVVVAALVLVAATFGVEYESFGLTLGVILLYIVGTAIGALVFYGITNRLQEK
jgi:hypothetical protein